VLATDVEEALRLPGDEAIHALSRLREGQWFERKSGQISPKDLAVPLVAMGNAEGGYVVVGLHRGAIDPVSDGKVNALRQAAIDFTSPPVRAHATELRSSSGDVVLLFRVDPGERVHETNRGECYLRVGDESRKLSFAQRRELEFDRGTAPFDGTPIDRNVDDLEAGELDRYRAVIGSSDTESMLAARDLRARDGRLTVAALLLFGRRPQQDYPNAHVRVLRYADTVRGTGSSLSLYADGDRRFEGSIPEQIDGAAAVIDQWLPKVSALAPSGRFEPRSIIPRDVWLEGLVNAVLHRSYSMAGDHVRVEIFPNRIEIENPGRFPGLADPTNPLSVSRYARNPRVVRVCSDLGIARELGEGIKRIFGEMRGLGLTDPVYTQTSGSVRLVLSSADALAPDVRARLSKGAQAALDALRLAGRPLGTGQVAEFLGVQRPTAIRHLNALRDERLVIWEGQSAKDPRASWRLP
jgi:ATP-dependent DNA helicase RecG